MSAPDGRPDALSLAELARRAQACAGELGLPVPAFRFSRESGARRLRRYSDGSVMVVICSAAPLSQVIDDVIAGVLAAAGLSPAAAADPRVRLYAALAGESAGTR